MDADHGLIGRAREQAELKASLAAVQAGQGSLLLLAGEAGVGKTRLALETLRAGDLPLWYAAARREAPAPFGPVVEALRAYLRATPGGLECGDPMIQRLAPLLPELAPASAATSEALAAPSGTDQAALFEAFRRAIAAIAGDRCAAIVLDDLQWADDDTCLLLPALAEGLDGLPLLIVGIYRSDEMPRGHPLRRMRTDLRRSGRLRELTVEPLGREDTAALLAVMLGGRPGRDLIDAVYRRTEGIPFFTEELATALLTTGRLRRDQAAIELDAASPMPVPDTVRDAVLLRLDALSEPARVAAEAAAVAGTRFDLELVAELTGADDGIAELIERAIIVEEARGFASFRHALVQEAIYATVPWTRRRTLHRAAADWLAARGAAPGEVAEHRLAGRDLERARADLLLAADAAAKLHAYRDAAHNLRRALEIWPGDAPDDGRTNALRRLGDCLQMSGDLTGAAAVWREVIDALARAGGGAALAWAHRRLAVLYRFQGLLEQAVVTRGAGRGSLRDGRTARRGGGRPPGRGRDPADRGPVWSRARARRGGTRGACRPRPSRPAGAGAFARRARTGEPRPAGRGGCSGAGGPDPRS